MRKKRRPIKNEIRFADGEIAKASLVELFRYADILAVEYGLGNCKSFSQFISMVNEEDPCVINGLMNAILERKRIQSGKSQTYSDNTVEEVGFRNRETITKSRTFGFEQGQLVDFLYNFGANKDDIKNALGKVRSGKIKLPQYDHSWITSEELSKQDFPWEQIKKEMETNMKSSVNVDVSAETLFRIKS